MKKTSVLVLILAIAVWLSTIIVVPVITKIIQYLNCSSVSPDECQNVISALGATGDIFGAVTSLFSGLALFSVAITLRADYNSRRESRKPFLMAQLTSDSMILTDPVPTGDRSIKLTASLDLSNQQNEAALNVIFKSRLSHNGQNTKISLARLPSPLMGNKSEEIKVEFFIQDRFFSIFLDELTSNRYIELITELEYESIEGVKWCTSVIYDIECVGTAQRNRLNALRGNNEDFEEQWSEKAAVSLISSPKSGTWKHHKI